MDASFSAIYSPPKFGKTSDIIYAFPDALFIAAPGALNPAVSVVGIEQLRLVIDAETIQDVTSLLIRYGKKVRAIVVDDFSVIADETIRRSEKKKNGWKFWANMRNLLLDLRGAARDAGCHIVFNCHERPAGTAKNGMTRRGGPKLPGQMPEDFPALADLVLRARYDPSRIGWPYAYSAGPDPDWIVGDRYDVVKNAAPMNLGEILRAAGYDIPRPKGLEWIEPGVEGLSAVLAPLGVVEERATVKAAAERLSTAQKDPRHIAWLLRDAVDRAALRRRRDIRYVLGPWLNPPAPGIGNGLGGGNGIGGDGIEGQLGQGATADQLTDGEAAAEDEVEDDE